MTFFVMRSQNLKDPSYNNWYTKEYASITKYDDHTLAIALPEPVPDPLWKLEEDLLPMPRHFYREFGPDFPSRYQWRISPSTGAYTIDPPC